MPFFELEGRVKAVSWTGGSGLMSGQWSFSREGKLERGAWKVESRDLPGRIKSASYIEPGSDPREDTMVGHLEFSLDRNGAVRSVLNRNDFGEYGYEMERDIFSGRLSSLSLRDMADSLVYEFRYGNYVCDSLGNWTSRHFTVKCGGEAVNSGTESRIIVYYDE